MKKKQFLLAFMATALLIVSCGPAQAPSNENGSGASAIQESTSNVSSEESGEKDSMSEESSSPENSIVPEESIVSEESSSSEESIAPSENEPVETASAGSESSNAPLDDAYEVIVNDSKKYPPKITLSGNHDDHFIADKICYYEGDKFFLMIDEGADLPGDLADKVALIIDTLEEKMGLTFKTSHKLFDFDCSTVNYGYNPWDGFRFGQKVPIFIMVDHEHAGYISCASAEYAIIYLDELMSMDVWNSIPIYRENPSWRRDYVNYYVFAHELTHVLTLRYTIMTKIFTEGGADYFAEQVINSLAGTSADFQKSRDNMYFNFSNHVKDNVTAANAEAIFRNDYKDLPHAERGDEYTFGRILSSSLAGSYGDNFMKDYITALENAGFAYEDMVFNLDQALIDKQTEIFKKLFGNDVFTKFADYYGSIQ